MGNRAITRIYGKSVFQSAGKISREQAEQKAISEYRAYEAKTLSPIEQEYLATLKALEKTTVHKLHQKK